VERSTTIGFAVALNATACKPSFTLYSTQPSFTVSLDQVTPVAGSTSWTLGGTVTAGTTAMTCTTPASSNFTFPVGGVAGYSCSVSGNGNMAAFTTTVMVPGLTTAAHNLAFSCQ
jgi:hypothetical protein